MMQLQLNRSFQILPRRTNYQQVCEVIGQQNVVLDISIDESMLVQAKDEETFRAAVLLAVQREVPLENCIIRKHGVVPLESGSAVTVKEAKKISQEVKKPTSSPISEDSPSKLPTEGAVNAISFVFEFNPPMITIVGNPPLAMLTVMQEHFLEHIPEHHLHAFKRQPQFERVVFSTFSTLNRMPNNECYAIKFPQIVFDDAHQIEFVVAVLDGMKRYYPSWRMVPADGSVECQKNLLEEGKEHQANMLSKCSKPQKPCNNYKSRFEIFFINRL